jgi:hypothetical protein
MRRTLIVALIALASMTMSVSSQERKPEERDIRPGYIVEIIGEGGRVVETVGAYLDEDEADEAIQKWNDNHPKSLLLTRKRKGDVEVKRPASSKKAKSSDSQSQTPSSKTSTIVMPALKSADPGPLKRGPAKAPPLSGKKGKGTIGKDNVTITFTGQGEKGEFVVSGDLDGKGRWVQLGPFVQMETGRATFEGKIDGNKIVGTRTMKEGGEKDKWSVLLSVSNETQTGGNPPADAAGPYKLWTGVYSGSATPKTYATLEEARLALSKYRTDNAGRQPHWSLQDRTGNEIDRGQDGVR